MAYNCNAAEEAYSFILKNIKSGAWKPGTKILSEDALVKKIGVSKVAVRSAVEKFSGMGILEKQQGSGTFVKKMSDLNLTEILFFEIGYSEILQLLEVRKFFEPATVEMFMKYCTIDDVEELQACYNQMVKNADNPKEFYEADYAFHKTLASKSKNIFLLKINSFFVDALREHQKSIHELLGPDNGIKYHALILEFIRKKDVEQAKKYMYIHIEETFEMMKEKTKNLSIE